MSSSVLDYLVSKVPDTNLTYNNTRCVSHRLDLPLRCEIVYLDYEVSIILYFDLLIFFQCVIIFINLK